MKNKSYIIVLLLAFCMPSFSAKEVLKSGIEISNLDLNVRPQDNFYRYVNGNWLDSAKIPDDHSVWGGFYELRKKTDADVLEILESALNDQTIKSNSDQGKVVAMYECFMDLEHRNIKGAEPISPYLSMIDSIEDLTFCQSCLAAYADGAPRNTFSQT